MIPRQWLIVFIAFGAGLAVAYYLLPRRVTIKDLTAGVGGTT